MDSEPSNVAETKQEDLAGKACWKSKTGHVKRPMNEFMLWSSEARRIFATLNPEMHNSEISKILGKLWKGMPDSPKQYFVEKAKEMREIHRRLYPDYKYKPKKKPASSTKTKSILRQKRHYTPRFRVTSPKQNSSRFVSQAPSLEDIGKNRDLSLQLQPNTLQNFMQNLNNFHQIPPSLWLPAAATAQIGTGITQANTVVGSGSLLGSANNSLAALDPMGICALGNLTGGLSAESLSYFGNLAQMLLWHFHPMNAVMALSSAVQSSSSYPLLGLIPTNDPTLQGGKSEFGNGVMPPKN